MVFIFNKEKYHAGFMYWYNPTVLRERWDVMLTATVVEIDDENHHKDIDFTFTGGKLRVENILHIRGNETLQADILTSGGGFDGLLVEINF